MSKIMNNIFEGAKFGDKFLMQCGKIAIYYGIDTINGKHIIIGEDDPNYKYRYIDGRCFTDVTCDYDIVSRYQESIDENKLDELAEKYSHNYYNWMDIYRAYKSGYKKAMEE